MSNEIVGVQALLWLAVSGIVYTYIGYPILLVILNALKAAGSDWGYIGTGQSRRVSSPLSARSVNVIVAAHNEQQHIAACIRHLLASRYQSARLQIAVGSDGSTDATVAQARSAAQGDARVTVTDFTKRRGKPSVVNDLVALAEGEVLVFTDANTAFEPTTIARLVRHFDDPKVGCVCGELRLVAEGATDNSDPLYWRYERFLKFQESRLNGLLGANGGVYAVRRSLYREIPPDTVVDDFWISMSLIAAGWRCVYDPEAIATETVPARMADEFGRRVRIGTGNYQALWHFIRLLNPGRGYLALTFWSHKVLRWFVPHCMIVALLTNLVLINRLGYACLLAAQGVFYLVAGIGWWFSQRRGTAPALLRLPLFLVSMNLALLIGFWRYLTGRFAGTWERTAR